MFFGVIHQPGHEDDGCLSMTFDDQPDHIIALDKRQALAVCKVLLYYIETGEVERNIYRA